MCKIFSVALFRGAATYCGKMLRLWASVQNGFLVFGVIGFNSSRVLHLFGGLVKLHAMRSCFLAPLRTLRRMPSSQCEIALLITQSGRTACFTIVARKYSRAAAANSRPSISLSRAEIGKSNDGNLLCIFDQFIFRMILKKEKEHRHIDVSW